MHRARYRIVIGAALFKKGEINVHLIESRIDGRTEKKLAGYRTKVFLREVHRQALQTETAVAHKTGMGGQGSVRKDHLKAIAIVIAGTVEA